MSDAIEYKHLHAARLASSTAHSCVTAPATAVTIASIASENVTLIVVAMVNVVALFTRSTHESIATRLSWSTAPSTGTQQQLRTFI